MPITERLGIDYHFYHDAKTNKGWLTELRRRRWRDTSLEVMLRRAGDYSSYLNPG